MDATQTTIPAASITRLATKATACSFRSRRHNDGVRVELAAAPHDGPAVIRAAADALAENGYTVRVIADGWKLHVTA